MDTMRKILILAILALGPQTALAEDLHAAAPPPAPHGADCQAAMDQIDDIASTPVIDVALTADIASRLAEGLALCRAGDADEGAKMIRRALRALRPSDTAQGYFTGR